MINPRELMIGNWLLGANGKPFQVDGDGIIVIYDESIAQNDVSPLPLSPAILEKCGFEVEYTIGGFLRWQKGDFKLLDRKLPHPIPQKQHVIYVHQLQNLYYSIYGEELNITL